MGKIFIMQEIHGPECYYKGFVLHEKIRHTLDFRSAQEVSWHPRVMLLIC